MENWQPVILSTALISFRSLHHHLSGSHETVCEKDDRQQGHSLDGVQLLLVLRLRLFRLRPTLHLRNRPPPHRAAPLPPEPLGDLHGCRTRALMLPTAMGEARECLDKICIF